MKRDPCISPTWREEVVLRAASAVPFLALDTIQLANIPHGVYRALRINGLLRLTAFGYEITPDGKGALMEIERVKTRHLRIERIAVLLLFLVISCPALAESKYVNYRVLPPAEYDYQFKGQLVTVIKPTRDEVNKFCNTPLAMGLGCMRFKSAEYCVVVVATDDIIKAAGYAPEVVVRHEVGHCNGWPKEHAGARMWKPKEQP